MTWFCVDVETDGPAPGMYSMLSIGLVAVRPGLADTFYSELQPLPDAGSDEEALAVSGLDRDKLAAEAPEPAVAFRKLATWVRETSVGRPVFVADNPSFDFAFTNWYFHYLHLTNPFGWSGRRIGDLYSGLERDSSAQWKHLRTTSHTHNALDDAIGNAEALLAMKDAGLKFPTA